MIAGYSGSPSYGVMVVETMLEYNVSAAAEIETLFIDDAEVNCQAAAEIEDDIRNSIPIGAVSIS